VPVLAWSLGRHQYFCGRVLIRVMSARLDPVTGTERRTIPVPYGHLVYIVSDLALSPTTDPSSRPVRELLGLLSDIDDAALVVVAGNLFHPDSTADLAKFIDATWTALPEVRERLQSFCAGARHDCIVLPGSDDHELGYDVRAQVSLESLGVSLATDLVLQVATAGGVRDLAVAAGNYQLDVTPVDLADRPDAGRLDDPPAVERFVASRVLYRRLAGWVWFPIFAVALFDLWGALTAMVGHLTHHHYSVHVLHSHHFWVNLFFDLVIIAVVETFIAGLAGIVVRRRFTRHAASRPRTRSASPSPSPRSAASTPSRSPVGSLSAAAPGPSSVAHHAPRWPSSTTACVRRRDPPGPSWPNVAVASVCRPSSFL
jgi:hypothetical protein